MSRPILSLKKKVSPSNIEVKDHSDDATKSPTPPKKELSPNVKAVKKLYRLKLRYPLWGLSTNGTENNDKRVNLLLYNQLKCIPR